MLGKIIIVVLILIAAIVAGYLLVFRNPGFSISTVTLSTPLPSASLSPDARVMQADSFNKDQIVFEKDIPILNKKLIVFNTNNNVDGFDSELYLTDSNHGLQTAKKVDVKLVSIADYEALISPDGKSYIVLSSNIGDGQKFYVIDSEGNLKGDEIVGSNYKTIGYGVKFGCQCGTSFKDWIDNSHFTLEIINSDGETYQIIIDAATGLADPASLKEIRS